MSYAKGHRGQPPKLIAGVCSQCRCTEAVGCAYGCFWVDEKKRSLCSACHQENRIVDAIRARPRDITLGEFFTSVMPDGSWDELDDQGLANAVVGAAQGLREPAGAV